MPWVPEVVHHQQHRLCVGIVHAQQVFDLPGPVDLGAPGLGIDTPPAGQGLDPAEDRAGPVPHVLGVLLQIASRARWDRVMRVSEELVGILVHAHHRA